jgi:hypothetical protein
VLVPGNLSSYFFLAPSKEVYRRSMKCCQPSRCLYTFSFLSVRHELMFFLSREGSRILPWQSGRSPHTSRWAKDLFNCLLSLEKDRVRNLVSMNFNCLFSDFALALFEFQIIFRSCWAFTNPNCRVAAQHVLDMGIIFKLQNCPKTRILLPMSDSRDSRARVTKPSEFGGDACRRILLF